jgi:RHS repeat-associated protein
MTYDMRWNLLCERRLDGAQVGEYVHGLRTDEILAANVMVAETKGKKAKERLETVYPLADGLGSTVALTDESGSVLQRYRYTAFGQPSTIAVSKASVAYRFLFTGREWLAGVGLNEHRNRYYQRALGRFLNADPVRLAGGINIYSYVYNSSTVFRDPFGLCCEAEDAVVANIRTNIASISAEVRNLFQQSNQVSNDLVGLRDAYASAIQGATLEFSWNCGCNYRYRRIQCFGFSRRSSNSNRIYDYFKIGRERYCFRRSRILNSRHSVCN